MRNYEMMIIINTDLSEEDIDKTIDGVTNLIKENNGKISDIDRWGKRHLAYPINKKKEAYYYIIYFQIDSEKIIELEKKYKLMENILRYLILISK
ncbi:MAG: 30S ribosomal protein S6 [Candidatus Cloacimonadota bacterium]|nr:MAG: 30S ribosomal protein S6 [Candidatus Cloacimonadota bacterium]